MAKITRGAWGLCCSLGSTVDSLTLHTTASRRTSADEHYLYADDVHVSIVKQLLLKLFDIPLNTPLLFPCLPESALPMNTVHDCE